MGTLNAQGARRLRAILAAASAALVGHPGVARDIAREPPQSLAALEAAVIRTLQAARVPGAAVVVIEGRQVVLAIDYGVADLASRRAVTADTVFRAGSIAKTFTAMATMVLVEEGRLTLDAPATQWAPDWIHANPWAATDPVRLVHLLEHSAGLDDVRYRHYLLDSATLPLAHALPAFGPYAVRWRPGSGTAYSNSGALVAGRAIEHAAGNDFVHFVTDRLTAPLGMTSARWTRSDDIAARLAVSYGADLRTPEPFIETPARPSGSLNITARDLAKLPLALLGGGALDGAKVLEPASVARMETSGTGHRAGSAGPALGWGLGLKADPAGRTVFFGHEGSIDGFVSRFAYAPALGAGYVIMANALSDAPLAVAGLVRAYLERGLPSPPAHGLPLSSADREAWVGQYQSITPRQELLRALIGLTQWEGATFDGDVLRYDGRRWLHQGRGVFRAEGAVAPGLVFSQQDQARLGGGVHAHTRDGTRRRVPGCEMALKLGAAAAYALALPISGLLLLRWLVAAQRERPGAPGVAGAAAAWWRIRLMPLAALWSVAAVPLGVLSLLATDDLAWLGRPSAAGWTVAALGLLAPLLWLAAAVTVWRTPAPLRTRVLSAWHLGLAALALCWLGAHGWLGLLIWQ